VETQVTVSLVLPNGFQLENPPASRMTVAGVTNFTNLVAMKPFAQSTPYLLYVSSPGLPSVAVEVAVNPGNEF
jgi:hypothetical protein